MRVVDEYVALRVVRGDWPDELPKELLAEANPWRHIVVR